MRRWSYLNVILSVNAVLLGALVWTQLATTPVLAGRASAQLSIPNAAEQRYEMLRAIRELQGAVEETRHLLAKRTLRVKVTNFQEIQEEPEPTPTGGMRFDGAPSGDSRERKSTRKPVVKFTPVEAPPEAPTPIETVQEAEWRPE